MFLLQRALIRVTGLSIILGCSACLNEDYSTGTTSDSSISSSEKLTIAGQPPAMVEPNIAYYFKAQAEGGNASTRVFSIQNKPTWASFNTVTGELTGTPVAGAYANVTVSVSDGMTSAQLPLFAITVGTGSSVTVMWAPPDGNTDGTPLNGLRGYIIHYGTSPEALNARIEVNSVTASSYMVTGLQAGVTYYFAVTAVNDLNMGGELSAVVSAVA